MSAGLRTNYSDGGAVASPTTVVAADMNGISAAVNSLFPSSASQASSATTLTLTATSDPVQIITGTTQAQTVALPTTSVAEGDQWMIVNSMTTASVTVNASGGGTVVTVGPGTAAIVTAAVATPTTAANWIAQYAGVVVTSGKVLTATNTITLAGTDGTTMTFPLVSGVVHAEQFITQTAAYTLASQTAAQKMFNATTNGTLTVAVGTYFFDCMFSLSAMSATSGSFGFQLGGSWVNAGILWQSEANKAALATAASAQNTVNTVTFNTAITTATTTTTGWAHLWGKVRVSSPGTMIPQVSLGVAAAAIVGADSFFRIWPIGSGTVTNFGSWS